MRFIKTSLALFSTAALTCYAQMEGPEKKLNNAEFMKQQQSMSQKYADEMQNRGLFNNVVPEGYNKKSEGDNGKDFIDNYSQSMRDLSSRVEQNSKTEKKSWGVSQKQHSRVAKDFLNTQEQQLEKWRTQFQEKGYLEGFDQKTIEEQTKRFQNAAKLVASKSNAGLIDELQREFGVDMSHMDEFNPDKPLEPHSLKGIFVTFNMSDSDLRMIMRAAVQQGAQLFLKGMHPDDRGIHDTIKRLQIIGQRLEVKPDVRFKPRYFDKYNITAAPAIVYAEGDKSVTASGITNTNWLKNKMSSGEDGYQGNYGDTVGVIEKDIRQEFKDRMAGLNLESKRKEVVKRFWKNKSFNNLPQATKNEKWYVDVRGKARRDIINPRGDKLASKGDVLNPIRNISVPLTLYIFDPMKPKQVEWVTNTYNREQPVGKTMILFSRLDKNQGWEHLSTLRQHFGQEVFELPPEMVRTFNLSHLPAKASTDLEKNLILVEQFKIDNE